MSPQESGGQASSLRIWHSAAGVNAASIRDVSKRGLKATWGGKGVGQAGETRLRGKRPGTWHSVVAATDSWVSEGGFEGPKEVEQGNTPHSGIWPLRREDSRGRWAGW